MGCQEVGCALGRNKRDSVSGCPGPSKNLVLVVKESQVDSGDRCGGLQVCSGYKKGAVIASLGNQAKIGDIDIPVDVDVVIVKLTVITRIAGVLSILVVVSPVPTRFPAVPVAALLFLIP